MNELTAGSSNPPTHPPTPKKQTIQVAKEEGVGALYRGLVPRVVNIALGGAIFFGAYEAFKKVADRAIVQR